MRVINCVLIIFIGLFLVNCTIQKRTFNKGYFVQWNRAKLKSNELTLDTFIKQRKGMLFQDSFQFQQANTLKDTTNIVAKFDLASKDTLAVFTVNAKIRKKISYSKTQATTLKNKQVPIKFDKEKGKKSLKFALLSVASVFLFFIYFFFSLYSNISLPAFFSIFLLISIYLAIAIFAILATVFFIKAFLKPKRK